MIRPSAVVGMLCALLGIFGLIAPSRATSPIGYPAPTSCSSSPPPLSTGTDPGFPGHWWNPKRYGTGWEFNFSSDQSQLTAYWLTFNSSHLPVWLMGGSGGTDVGPNGEKEFWAPLYLLTSPRSGTPTSVGTVAVVFLKGSATAAALRWQWNAAGGGTYDECVYNFMSGAGTSSTGSTSSSGPAQVDGSYTGQWYDPNQSGWGVAISAGMNPQNTQSSEIDEPLIYDTTGQPVWLQASFQNPNVSYTSTALAYYYSNYSGGIPTYDCQSGCVTSVAGGSYARSYTTTVSSPNNIVTSTANINATVAANAIPGHTVTAVNWPNSGSYNPATLTKATDYYNINVNVTSCQIPAGQTTCPVTVGWTSTSSSAGIYRRDLTTGLLSAGPIWPGASGSNQDNLQPGADVQYELRTPSTLLFISPEVVVPAATGNNTPVSATPAAAAVPARDSISDAVGATVAQFRVDEGGNATYSVPIQVPPGTAGVVPKVALSYNSRGPSGVMGPGWSITGSSQITRCRMTREDGDFISNGVAVDGISTPVNFTPTDRFCLDGVRLLLLSNSTAGYGVNLSTYSPENDPTTLVTATVSTAAAGPDSFSVQRKDGTTSIYGYTSALAANNASATAVLNGQTVNVLWNLARVQDSVGNYIDYVYTNQPGSSLPFAAGAIETVLSQVNYTGNSVLGTATYASVIFSYTTLGVPNVRLGYQSGVAFLQSQQLKSVSVSDTNAGGVIRYYELAYSTSVSGSGYQELTSLLECRNSFRTVCYPATTFGWSQATYQFDRSATTQNAPGGAIFYNLVGYKVADIDGDGRQDFVWAVNDGKCTGGSSIYVGFIDRDANNQMTLVTAGASGQAQSATCSPIDLTNNDRSWYLIDYNGDGKADLMIGDLPGNNWKIHPSLGRAFTTTVFDTTSANNDLLAGLTTPIKVPTDNPNLKVGMGILADLNGDGLPDFIYPVTSSTPGSGIAQSMVRMMVRQNNTYVFSDPYTLSFNFNSPPPCYTANPSTCTPTFNVFYYDAGHHSAIATDVNGSGRAGLTFIIQFAPDNCSTPPCPVIQGLDPGLTGDGGTPSATSSSSSGTTSTATDGSGFYWYQFTVTSTTTPLAGSTQGNVQLQEFWNQKMHSSGGALPNNPNNFFVADINGDGLADILYQDSTTPTTYWALINTGNATTQQYQTPIQVTNISNGNLLQLADVNGDGKLDIVFPVGSPSGNMTYSYVDVQPSSATTWQFTAPVALASAPQSLAAAPHSTGQWLSLFGDFDGDGATDFLSVLTGSNSSTANLYTTRPSAANRYQFHDAITTFTNGLGASTKINYQPLTNNAVYLGGTNSVTATNFGYGSPVFNILAPLYVVQSATSAAPAAQSSNVAQDNVNAVSAVYYQYQWARMQSGGRGFLGFKKIITYDVNDQALTGQYVVTTTNYNQSFPFTGTPIATVKSVRSGTPTLGAPAEDTCAASGPEAAAGCFGASSWPGVPGVVVSYGASLMGCTGPGCAQPAATFCSTPTSFAVYTEPNSFTAPATLQPLFVYVRGTQDQQFDLASTNLSGYTWNYFCYDTSAPAAYSNLLAATTVNQDSATNTIAQKFVTNTYTDNVAKWWLGRLTHSQVQFVRPGTPAFPARWTDFTYDPNTGLLTSERIQKGDTADRDLRTMYVLDSYGNRQVAYQCSSDLSDANCLTSGGSQQQTGTQVHRFAKTNYSLQHGRYAQFSSVPFYSPSGLGGTNFARIVSFNAYDEFGNAVSKTSANNLVQTDEYGALGRPYFSSDSTGRASTTTYRLCSAVSCPSDAKFRSQTVTVGAPSSWTYFDLLGRPLLKITQAFDANPANQAYSGVCTVYDAHGRSVYQSEPFNPPASIGSDGSPTLPNGLACNGASAGTTTKYDVIGRVVKITNPDGGVVVRGYSLSTLSPGVYGLVTTTTNPRNGNWMVTETRNAMGEVISTQDPSDGTSSTGLTVTQRYDAAGDVVQITRNGGGGAVTTYAYYDVLGRKTQVTDPDAGTTTFSYNPAGDVISQTDAKGQTISQSYDAMGRRWQRSAGAITDTWTYDTAANGLGMLASESRTQTGQPTFSRAMTYDSYGRPYQRSTSFAAHTFAETTSFDAHGRLAAQQDASGYSLMPEYSPSGFIGKQLDTRAGAVYQILGTDPRGHVTNDMRGGNSVLVASTQFDPATGRISHICSGTNCGLQELTYKFDVAGNLTQRSRGLYGAMPTTETFVYDALNRLTTSQLTVMQGATQNPARQTIGLAYDGLGNICTKNGVAYQYGPGSGCTNPTASGGPHEVMAVGGAPYGYDSDGNQTSGAGRTLTYNALNQMTSAVNGPVSSQFLYTPEGEKFQRVDTSGSTTNTTWFVGNVEILSTGGNVTEYRRYLAGAAIDYVRTTGSNETRYVFADHLGSTDTIVSAQGNVIETASFDAHGSLRNASNWVGAGSAPTSTTHGFTGHEEMYNLGLVHMNGRIYDPALGRMLQADPLTGPGNQSLNRYSYVVNNPLSLTDPTGYSWWGDLLKDAAIVAITVYTGGWGATLWAEESYAAAIAVVGAGGFAAGVIQTGRLQGGLYGAFSAELFFGVGQYFDSAGWAHTDGDIGASKFNVVGYSAKILAHGVAGGVMSSLEGGKFGNGFLSAGVAEAAAPGIDKLATSSQRVVAAAMLGGTTSVISGGKFANGAVTAAFSYAFSSVAGKVASDRAMDARMQAMAAQMEDLTYAVAFEPPALPQGVVDFAAGMGDTVSFGASSRIRSLYDIDGGVNESSAAYRYGGDAGVANSLLMGAGVFRGAFIFGETATVTRWGGEGVWYMVGEQSTSSWWLSGTRFMYSYDSAVTTEVAASRLSYPPGWEWIKGLFGQRVMKPGP